MSRPGQFAEKAADGGWGGRCRVIVSGDRRGSIELWKVPLDPRREPARRRERCRSRIEKRTTVGVYYSFDTVLLENFNREGKRRVNTWSAEYSSPVLNKRNHKNGRSIRNLNIREHPSSWMVSRSRKALLITFSIAIFISIRSTRP